MSPTSWTERVAVGGGFQIGRPQGTGADDYFIDFLFEGSGFFSITPTPHTERTATATVGTERTAPSVAWTERVV